MKVKCQVSMYWQLKVAILLAFFAFWVGKCDAQLGTPPIIAVQPVGCSVQKGGTVTINVTATSLTPMNFTWNINGHPVPLPTVTNTVVPLVGTISTFTINNAQPANSGNYNVIITNAVGSVTSINASVSVSGGGGTAVTPLTLTALSNSPAIGFSFQVNGPMGSNFVVEASTDFENWSPLYTNKSGSGTITYTDSSATNYSARFYRACLH